MTLREFTALVSAVLITVGTIWYIYVAIKGDKVKPVLASWIVVCGTMVLSFTTYWTSPKHSIVSNASNVAGVISTVGILITVLWLNLKNEGVIHFSRFQKGSLAAASVIATFWVIIVWGFNRTGFYPNILTQILMLVGYFVTAEKLWQATKNTESLFTWTTIMIGSAIALYTGIVSRDTLATLYATRATVTSATIVWLMYRIELKNS